MVKRSLSISSGAALNIERRQLTMRQNGHIIQSAPLEDLAVIVVDTPETTWTSALLSECGEYGIAVVFCGPKHLPSSIVLPTVGNHLMAYVQRRQLEAKLPTKKRLWQTIVAAKIRSQADTLKSVGKNDRALRLLLNGLKSGDSTNVEAQAAARYFPTLFGPEFIRDTDAPGLNSRLNYGYAILRAAVARAVVLSGLNPSVGIWHHNRFDAFPLADDLIEPLRPIVDKCVHDSLGLFPDVEDLTPPVKRHLLQVLTTEVGWDGDRYPLDTALERFCAQVREALVEGGQYVQCPTV